MSRLPSLSSRRVWANHFNFNRSNLALSAPFWFGRGLRIIERKDHFGLALDNFTPFCGRRRRGKAAYFWWIERAGQFNRVASENLIYCNNLQFWHPPRSGTHLPFRQNFSIHGRRRGVQTYENAHFGLLSLHNRFQLVNSINAYVLAALDRHDGAIGLFYANAVISNDPVYPAVCARTFFWKAAQRKYRPLLKLKPIACSQCTCVIGVFRTAKQLVALLDSWSKCFNQPALYHVNCEIGYIYPDPLTFQIFRRLNRCPATTKWVENNVALVRGRADDSLQKRQRFLRRIAKPLFSLRIYWVNVRPNRSDWRSKHFISKSFVARHTRLRIHQATLIMKGLHLFFCPSPNSREPIPFVCQIWPVTIWIQTIVKHIAAPRLLVYIAVMAINIRLTMRNVLWVPSCRLAFSVRQNNVVRRWEPSERMPLWCRALPDDLVSKMGHSKNGVEQYFKVMTGCGIAVQVKVSLSALEYVAFQ